MQIPYAAPVGLNREAQLRTMTIGLSGRLSFTDNMQGEFVTFTIIAANTPQVVILPSKLQENPSGFIVTYKDRACDIFASSTDKTAWSVTAITLEGTVASALITIWVF